MQCQTCASEIIDDATFCPFCGQPVEGAEEPEEFSYDTFISYHHSPEDIKMAKRVQKTIETYRPPKDSGVDDVRSMKAFRDEDELSSAGLLPDRINNALRQSRTMVVICSEGTQKSMWVAKEVELFASYHGRDRIFTILIGKSRKDSYPQILLKKRTVLEDGNIEDVEITALGADLRKASGKGYRAEILRILAAIMGCGYDDLRQREKSRKTKRIVVAVAFLIAFLLAAVPVIVRTGQTLQTSEARSLVASSEEYLEAGDRIMAIETALDALPKNARSRQAYLPEARVALEKALGVYPTVNFIGWRSAFLTEDTNYEIKEYAIDDEACRLAVLDSGMNLIVYDLTSNRQICECAIPVDTKDGLSLNASYYRLEACAGRVLCFNLRTSTVFAFDSESGSLLWELADVGCYARGISANRDYLACAGSISTWSGQETAEVSIIDLVTGQERVNDRFAIDFNSDDFVIPAGICLNDDASLALVAIESQAYAIDVNSGKTTRVDAASGIISDIDYHDGMFLVCSGSSDEDTEKPFTVEAYDSANLAPLWSFTDEANMALTKNGTSFAFPPKLKGFLPSHNCFLLTVGKNYYGISAKDGSLVFADEAVFVLFDAHVLPDEDDDRFLVAGYNADTKLSFALARGIEDPSWYPFGFFQGSYYPMRCTVTPNSSLIAAVNYDNRNRVTVLTPSGLNTNESFASFPYAADALQPMQNSDASCGCFIVTAVPTDPILSWNSDGGFKERAVAASFSDYGIDVQKGDYGACYSTSAPSIIYLYGYSSGENDKCLLVSVDTTDWHELGSAVLDEYVTEHSTWLIYQRKRKYSDLAGDFAFSCDKTIRSADDNTLLVASYTMTGLFLPRVLPLTSDALVSLDPSTLEEKSRIEFAQDYGQVYQAWALGKKAVICFAFDNYLDEGSKGLPSVHLFDLTTGQQKPCDLDAFAPSMGNGAPKVYINEIRSSLVEVCDDGFLRGFSLPSGKVKWKVPFQETENDFLAVSPSGKKMLLQQGNGECMLINLKNGKTVGSSAGSVPLINNGRFSDDETLFFASTNEGPTGELVTLSLDKNTFGAISRISSGKLIDDDQDSVLIVDESGYAEWHYCSFSDLLEMGESIVAAARN